MAVHAWYDTPEAASGLRDQYVRLCGSDAVDLLVAVPSTADVVAAAVLAVCPRTLLLFHTQDSRGDGVSAEVTASAQAVMDWAGDRDVRVVRVPDEDGLRGVSPQGLLAELLAQREYRSAKRVVYLATGGMKAHTTVLARQGEVTRSKVLLIETPREPGGAFLPEGTRLKLDEPPREVLEHHGIEGALAATRDRRYDAAFAALDAIPEPRGPEVSVVKGWVEAWKKRDAMDFVGAREAAEAVGRLAERAAGSARVDQVRRQWQEQAALCQDLSAAPGDQPRTLLVLEVAWRALQEYDAGRQHLAGLLAYRAIEAVMTERLRTRWKIDDSANGPRRVGGTPVDPEAIEKAAKSLGVPNTEIDRPLGLMAKLVLLVALNDELLPEGVVELGKRVKAASEARNKSLFAHGFEPALAEHVGALLDALGLGLPARAPAANRGLLSLLIPRGPQAREVAQGWRRVQGPHLA